MAYDEQLAARIRRFLDGRPDVIEVKMFGGLVFMVRGHMAFGIVKDELMVRLGAEGYEDALQRPHARPMDFTGRPMKGMVYVAKPGFRTAAALRTWVDLACANAESLPAKKQGAKR
jgi:TfoX/Sxy family transcriptional regulator of competence genes